MAKSYSPASRKSRQLEAKGGLNKKRIGGCIGKHLKMGHHMANVHE